MSNIGRGECEWWRRGCTLFFIRPEKIKCKNIFFSTTCVLKRRRRRRHEGFAFSRFIYLFFLWKTMTKLRALVDLAWRDRAYTQSLE